MAEKRYLLTPGPTPVPPEVLAELAKPVIHHRERDFREVYEQCLVRLGEVYRTQNDVLMSTTSGTGAFASVSPVALEAAARATSPRYVMDWERTRKAQAKLDAPFTPAVSIVRALNVALGLLLEEGLEAAFDRHARLGRACREGAKAMGLELFSPDEERSAVVTAIRAPEGVDATEIVQGLRNRFGITIANGQAELKGKIFRIGHIGWFDVFDITTARAPVELVLTDAGADIERGGGVTRAREAWAEHTPV